ncbi:MAG TPA: ecotin family protein [Pseudomonadales bacterium]
MTLSRLPKSLALAALLLPVLATGSEATDLTPFPEAADGMTRLVVVLPEMSRDESNYAVELVAGKTIATDGVNLVRMDTALETRNLEGWGYTYYEMTGSGRTSSTLMATPEGAPEVRRFVGGPPLNVRFNSRLPVVVDVPEGFEVRYRIWAAADEYLQAGPG